MADDGAPHAARRPVADLVLLGRAPTGVRVVIAAALLLLGTVVAQGSLVVQHHFAESGSGRIARLLGAGPSAATAWTGWAAALFFGIAVLRLRRGAPEPPAGRAPVESMTLPQLRAGLLREYHAVRWGLVLLSLVSFLESARAVRYALAAVSGDGLAGGVLVAAVVQAVGLVAAAAVLGTWTFIFRDQLHRLGVLSSPGG